MSTVIERIDKKTIKVVKDGVYYEIFKYFVTGKFGVYKEINDVMNLMEEFRTIAEAKMFIENDKKGE